MASTEVQPEAPQVQQDPALILQQLHEYDWSDPEFQAGLESITGPLRASGASEEELEKVSERAKVFFFSNKTGVNIPYEQYEAWKSQRPLDAGSSQQPAAVSEAAPAESQPAQESQASTAAQGEPYPASFDKIIELITTGRTDEIPGIKDIPLKINEETPTEAKLPQRSKPWENAP